MPASGRSRLFAAYVEQQRIDATVITLRKAAG
jgi:hypothetical protein